MNEKKKGKEKDENICKEHLDSVANHESKFPQSQHVGEGWERVYL